MVLGLHVDEVDDDDAAEIAQAQLPRNSHGRLEVRAEDGVFQRPVTHERAGIHVNRRHRLRLVNHQIATRLQRHFAVQGFFYFLFNAMQVEDGTLAGVLLNFGSALGHERVGEFSHFGKSRGRIDQHTINPMP